MADESQNKNSAQPMFWLALVALVAMLLLAMAALTLLSKHSSAPQVVNNNTLNTPGLASPTQAVASAPAPAARPDHGSEAQRMSGQMMGAPSALPGPVIPPMTGRREEASRAVRADTQSPPFYTTLSQAAKVQFRIRVSPSGPSKMSGPVPFRVHAWQSGPDGRVAGVAASVPSGEDRASYSYLPEVAYKPSSATGPILGITISNPRKTSVVNTLRAPLGFQFFVAEITAKNLGADAVTLDPDMFEIQDSDRVPYLPNPELLSADFPSTPLGTQSAGRFTAAFLVPSDASLVSLVAREPGDGLIASPLSPR